MTTRFGRKLLRTIRHWMPARHGARTFPPNASAYRIRQEIASPYLAGRGIEIGAGANPQLLPLGAEVVLFDVRSRAELAELFEEVPDVPIHAVGSIREHFPRGAPFLIAHNVLEHTPDPISALRQWHEHLTDGG